MLIRKDVRVGMSKDLTQLFFVFYIRGEDTQ